MSSNDKTHSNSRKFHSAASKVLAGGVSRQMVDRLPHPDYVSHGKGCRVTDVDGVTRIDFANNTGSLIHGHAHPEIVEAVSQQLKKGTAFSLATEAELQLAQCLCARNSNFEKIRFMNSGSEAVMAGIKAARASTGRAKIAKCEGCYHGTYDFAEVSQSSTPANWGDPDRPNAISAVPSTPQSVLDEVIVFPLNDVQHTIAILEPYKTELACVLIDPLPHRAGLMPVTLEFMTALREWTRENGILLLVDEVLSFRMNYGGALDWYEIRPDFIALGKIIGGGFPVGALAGTDESMSVFDRDSPNRVSFSGTFSANPITMTAGRVAMDMFDREAVLKLNELGERVRTRIRSIIREVGITAYVTGTGSMFRIYLKEEPPTDYRSAYLNPTEAMETELLIDFLYRNGCILINTCTAALSTVTTETEIDYLSEVLEAGLRKILNRRKA